jgi:peptidase E
MVENLSIVAVGGGNPTSAAEHLKKAVEMTGVEHQPHVLIVPTAKSVQEDGYRKKFESDVNKAKRLYEEELGLPWDILHGYDTIPSRKELEEKLEWADVALIFGGRSEYMMEEWKKHGIDKLLKARALGGLVLSGISAGAIAPFMWGQTDPFPNSDAKIGQFIRVDGLGLIKAAVGSHFNKLQDGQAYRREDFLNMFAEYCLGNLNEDLRFGFGVDSLAAIVVDGGLIKSASLRDAGITIVRKDPKTQVIVTEKMSAGDVVNIKDL